jgi:hypothetical protein
MNQYMPEGMLITGDKNYEYTSSPEGLERAMRSNLILEGIATLCDHNFNLHINLPADIKAIIPYAIDISGTSFFLLLDLGYMGFIISQDKTNFYGFIKNPTPALRGVRESG